MNYRLLFLLCLSSSWLQAQIGGLFTYEFLNFSPSARISSLGGTHIAVMDDDVNIGAVNPAALNPEMHQQLSFSHAFHPGSIQYGYAAGAIHHPKTGITFHTGIRYANYGKFDETNTLGEVEGTFKAVENAITIGAGRHLDERLYGGINLRFITSRLANYQSLGLTADLALLYLDTARQLIITAVAKNAGTQLTSYRDGNKEPLPFELQAGISKRLQHLPFRFSVVYRYLDRWNILYDDPNAVESAILFGDVDTERSKSEIWLDNFARHLVFNGELFIGAKENLRLRLGYSYLTRKELSLDEYRTLSGITFGAGIKINRFRIDYGRTSFHLAGGVNQISIATNLKEFK
ncbi:MAG: type IX secretion system protein PorQ [Saprospiraceae bacterium]